MSLRIEVLDDSRIEIMRPESPGGFKFFDIRDLETAVRIIRFLIKRDLQAVKAERFVPKIQKEARAAYRELERRAEDAARQR